MSKKKKTPDPEEPIVPALRVDTMTWTKIEATRRILGARVGNPDFKRADAVRWLLTQAKVPA